MNKRKRYRSEENAEQGHAASLAMIETLKRTNIMFKHNKDVQII